MQQQVLVSKIKEQEAMVQHANGSSVWCSQETIHHGTDPSSRVQEPTKAGTKGDKSKSDHKRDGEKRKTSTEKIKGSSDGSSGLGGGDQMPQASSQGVEAALSLLIAKVERLIGEMNELKQQKARSVHAQSFSEIQIA